MRPRGGDSISSGYVQASKISALANIFSYEFMTCAVQNEALLSLGKLSSAFDMDLVWMFAGLSVRYMVVTKRLIWEDFGKWPKAVCHLQS